MRDHLPPTPSLAEPRSNIRRDDGAKIRVDLAPGVNLRASGVISPTPTPIAERTAAGGRGRRDWGAR